MTMTESGCTRRDLGRSAVKIGASTVLAPSAVSVAVADTDSGHVELTTTATVPADTSITVTVVEDTDGGADRQETVEVSDGTTTAELPSLQSVTGEGAALWLEVSLSTADVDVTPQLDSAMLMLPETFTEPETPTEEPVDQPDEPQTLSELWNSYPVFVAATVLGYGGLTGVMSRSLSVGAWVGYLAFVYIALTAGTPLFRDIALVTMVLVFLGSMFKLVRLEFEGEE